MSVEITLKARLFDAQEEIIALQARNKEAIDGLIAIAGLVGLTGNNITIQSITEAVEGLLTTPEDEQLELPLE